MRLASPADSATGPDVTPVERDIGHLAAQAFTDAEIAQSLGLSEDKVAESIASLIRKLGLIDRLDLMLFFFFSGCASKIEGRSP